jgi:hypothetical protein
LAQTPSELIQRRYSFTALVHTEGIQVKKTKAELRSTCPSYTNEFVFAVFGLHAALYMIHWRLFCANTVSAFKRTEVSIGDRCGCKLYCTFPFGLIQLNSQVCVNAPVTTARLMKRIINYDYTGRKTVQISALSAPETDTI